MPKEAAIESQPGTEVARARRGFAIVTVAVFLFAIGVTVENRARTEALRSTFAPDLGSFHNQAFNIARGRDISYLPMAAWFEGGDFDGPSVYRSAHFSPLRTLLLPLLYRFWPRLETLMFLQGLLIGLGAFGLYGFVLDRTRHVGLGLAAAGTYLLHPAILATATNDLREITLGIGPALIALRLHAAGRFRLSAVAAVVALAARSEFALLVAAFGFVNFRLLPPAARRVGLLLPIALAVAWGGLADVYYRHYYGVHWPLLAFAGGQSPAAALWQWASRLPQFFLLMLLPALGALATPEAFALAMPFVALAKRVHSMQFPPHHLQHLSPAIVAIFWGFAASLVFWAKHPSGRDRRVVAGLWAVALACGGMFAGAAWNAYPRELKPYQRLYKWADRLPADATIVVPGFLSARFSDHTRVIDYTRLPMTHRTTPAEQDAALTAVIGLADLVVVYEGDPAVWERTERSGLFEKPHVFRRYAIFPRRRDAPRVVDADARLQAALLWSRFDALEARGATLAAAR